MADEGQPHREGCAAEANPGQRGGPEFGIVTIAFVLSPRVWCCRRCPICREDRWGSLLHVDVDGHLVQVIVERWSGPKATTLINSEVRVEGIDAAAFSPNGIYVGPQILVYDQTGADRREFHEIGSFDTPVTPIDEVLRNPNGNGIETLVHVRGMVTGGSRGRFYMEENGHAVLVQTEDARLPLPGDLVDALGHPIFAGFGVLLQHGLFRTTGMTRVPLPLPTSANLILGQGQEKTSIDRTRSSRGNRGLGRPIRIAWCRSTAN